MNTANDKFENARFNSNKNSFISFLITSTVSFVNMGIENLKIGNNLIALFVLGYCILFMALVKYIWSFSFKSSKALDLCFYILFSFACCFFPVYLTSGYFYGMPITQSGKVLYISLGILNILITSRLFKTKELSYLFYVIYVLYMAFIFYLFKILYGYEVIESYL